MPSVGGWYMDIPPKEEKPYRLRPSVGTWLAPAPLSEKSENVTDVAHCTPLDDVPYALRPSVGTWLTAAPAPIRIEKLAAQSVDDEVPYALRPSVGTWLTRAPVRKGGACAVPAAKFSPPATPKATASSLLDIFGSNTQVETRTENVEEIEKEFKEVFAVNSALRAENEALRKELEMLLSLSTPDATPPTTARHT